ncbi:MAG: NUDIX hydrolase [bacterium]|nr:NUDIX hydrolase [bacterium]
MKTDIVLTGILKDGDMLLVVKRNEDDDLFPGAWEFPGGHLENGELLKEGLARELKEEIGFEQDFDLKITHYFDEIKNKNGNLIHNIEIDFIIDVDKEKTDIILSDEHCAYEWVTKDSSYLDDFIKEKLKNLN